MHPLERLPLVLAAAFALTVTQAHLLVRTVFTAYALWHLVENHSGYDFPWMWANVVPCGLVSGSRRHEFHHKYGTDFFGQYFTMWYGWWHWGRYRCAETSWSGGLLWVLPFGGCH